MHKFRVWWNSFKTVALLLSFVLNMASLILVLLLLMQVFQLKNGIVEPLLDGTHRSIAGLDAAVLEGSGTASGDVSLAFDLAVRQTTSLVLTEEVPLAANAAFTLPGGGGVINGRVDIVLPRSLVLPVRLDLSVPVSTRFAVELPADVRINVRESELHPPLQAWRDLLTPYVRVLDNSPRAWGEMPDFVRDALRGEGVNLVAPTEDSENPVLPAP